MEKISQLEKFINKTSKLDPVDNIQKILIEGMELIEIGDAEGALLFDVSRPTVNRWRNGSTAPHRAMRAPLCTVLRKKALKRLKTLKQRAQETKVVIKLKTKVKQRVKAHIIGICIHNFMTDSEANAYLLGFREGRTTMFEDIESIKIDGKKI